MQRPKEEHGLVSETLFGVRNKVQEAIDLFKKHEPPEGYYLAFSGGKDSVCIYWIAKMAGVTFDAHYNLTTVDPPELVRFIKTFPDVQINHPEKTMWELIVHKVMPPTRMVRYCCKSLKEGYGNGRVVVTGVRADESRKRKDRGEFYKFKSKQFLNPIYFWTEEDVWDYIEKNNLAYCSLYDEPGLSRLGCIMCPVGNIKKRMAEAERYPKFKAAYLRTFGRMIQERNRRGMDTKWKSSQEVMDWWLSQ